MGVKQHSVEEEKGQPEEGGGGGGVQTEDILIIECWPGSGGWPGVGGSLTLT